MEAAAAAVVEVVQRDDVAAAGLNDCAAAIGHGDCVDCSGG